jgi:V/A-type H+/Na+-transporting ATPase subunit I
MIVPLVKVTVYGQLKDKQEVLAHLQGMGLLHLIPLSMRDEELRETGPSSEAREALSFLLSCPVRRRQALNPAEFGASKVEAEALRLKERLHMLTDERDFLIGRIKDLRPWGNFAFPDLEDLANHRLWFFVVPHHRVKEIPVELTMEVVHRDNRFSYVVVISEKKPEGMPVARVHTGNRSISQLEQRLEEVELELEDLQAGRTSLTRYCTLFGQSLAHLEDRAALSDAAGRTYDDSPVFALQAWCPRKKIAELQEYTAAQGLVLDRVDPDPEEVPPTLFNNASPLAVGEDLVCFYQTPSYWHWDPSSIVFVSFTVFFGMIMADAGYGLLMALALWAFWNRMGRSEVALRLRTLFTAITGGTLVYGVLIGSYFGLEPPEHSLLTALQVVHMHDFSLLMRISVLIGAGHLILANCAVVWRWRHSIKAMAPLGWVFIFSGALVAWFGYTLSVGAAVLKHVGFGSMVLGGVLVLFFSELEGSALKRFLMGLERLTKLSGAFGDTLSYLRLFALGLASASLAMSFNDIARQLHAEVQGFGLLLALLVLLIGHGLNIVIAISSGFIHGLRLNFIEFFNWSGCGEGYAFKAFRRKEKSSWIT